MIKGQGEAHMEPQGQGQGSSRQGLEWLVVIGSVIFALIVIAVAAWWWLRPKPPAATATATRAPATATLEASPTSQPAASILYAKADGTGMSCDSWKNACHLQVALTRAQPGQEIWVQAG